MPLVFSWRGHSLPAAPTLVSALARDYLMTETAYYCGGCDLT